MNKIIIKQLLLALLLITLATSCSDRFGDDLRDLGSRVEALENDTLKLKTFNRDIAILQDIITIIEKNGYISNITPNDDGSITITMTYIDENGNKIDKEPITLHQGTAGKDADFVVGVKQYTDGLWYWTVNGVWLRDENGKMVRAGGQNGQDGIAPMVRIVTGNNGKQVWQMSLDGGKTWTNMGVTAEGADGTNGKDGVETYFDYVRISADGSLLIIKLIGSQTEIKIPINNN